MKNTTSIVFTGDIGFDRYMDRKWEDEQLISKEILEFFHSADHVCASVEGALIDAPDDGSRGIFFHSMNPEATGMYQKIGAIVNRIPEESVIPYIDTKGIHVLSYIPSDSNLAIYDIEGRNIMKLPNNSNVVEGTKKALVEMEILK